MLPMGLPPACPLANGGERGQEALERVGSHRPREQRMNSRRQQQRVAIARADSSKQPALLLATNRLAPLIPHHPRSAGHLDELHDKGMTVVMVHPRKRRGPPPPRQGWAIVHFRDGRVAD